MRPRSVLLDESDRYLRFGDKCCRILGDDAMAAARGGGGDGAGNCAEGTPEDAGMGSCIDCSAALAGLGDDCSGAECCQEPIALQEAPAVGSGSDWAFGEDCAMFSGILVEAFVRCGVRAIEAACADRYGVCSSADGCTDCLCLDAEVIRR